MKGRQFEQSDDVIRDDLCSRHRKQLFLGFPELLLHSGSRLRIDFGVSWPRNRGIANGVSVVVIRNFVLS